MFRPSGRPWSLPTGSFGLSVEEFRFNLLPHGDEMIDGDLEFDIMVKKRLKIQWGIINDIDIHNFVDLMLWENRPDRKGLRIVGNGSVTFKGVQVSNLVVAGTIQGVDLSREARMQSDNTNGSYGAKIREQEALINKQRLPSTAYGPGSSLKVFSHFRGHNHLGHCYVHSCGRTTPPPTPPASRPTIAQPTPMGFVNWKTPLALAQHFLQPPIKYVQQFYPNMLPPPMNLVNSLAVKTTWRPMCNFTAGGGPFAVQLQDAATVYQPPAEQPTSSLVDPNYLEHKSMLQAQAISDRGHQVFDHIVLL